jgi:sugar phosphate isomerase/epimerase
MAEVYASTGAFGATDLEAILRQASALGIGHIELSSGVAATPRLRGTVMAHRHRFRFLVHNYFPPPARPFLLNLATPRDDIGRRAMALCRDAVGLCAGVGAPFYSVHCGFTFDSPDGAHLGNASQMALPRISMDEAMDHFARRITALCRFGAARGVTIAVENNVIAGFGVIDGENRLCLGADLEGLKHIFDAVDSERLGLLFDVGHAKVNQQTIGADMGAMLTAFQDRLVAFHVSDNDGVNDQNLPLAADSPLAGILSQYPVPRIVESYGLTPAAIRDQVSLLASL